MAIKNVLQFGNPLLRKSCIEVMDFEIDHLNGTLFIDHIEKPESLMMVEEWDKRHSYIQ